MSDKKQIDNQYLEEATALEDEYFEVIISLSLITKGKHKGKLVPVAQHRELREGKDLDEFNQLHGDLWQRHQAELEAGGFARPTSPPGRDLEAEIDNLRGELGALQRRLDAGGIPK